MIRKPFNKQTNQNKKPFGASVNVWEGDVDAALRKLNKILENDDRQRVLSQKECYEKPSIVKRRKRALARKNNLRKPEDSKNDRYNRRKSRPA